MNNRNQSALQRSSYLFRRPFKRQERAPVDCRYEFIPIGAPSIGAGQEIPFLRLFFLFLLQPTGFDTYFKSLRPKSNKVCNQNVRNVVKGSRIFNCRNPWFREFWAQHFKCQFGSGNSSNSSNSVPECKGGDKLSGYEQEGLVPFVGKLSTSHISYARCCAS
jgi:hypothetical protein